MVRINHLPSYLLIEELKETIDSLNDSNIVFKESDFNYFQSYIQSSVNENFYNLDVCIENYYYNVRFDVSKALLYQITKTSCVRFEYRHKKMIDELNFQGLNYCFILY